MITIAARLQQLQGAQIDFLVTAMRGRQAFSVFGKGRRIENDHLEAACRPRHIPSTDRTCNFAEGDVFYRIAGLLISACRFDSCGRSEVYALDVLALVREGQREAALVAEAIENAAGGVAPRGQVVLPLVEERPRFLALGRVRRGRSRRSARPRSGSGTSPCKTPTRCSRPSSSRTRGSLRSRIPFGRRARREDLREQTSAVRRLGSASAATR